MGSWDQIKTWHFVLPPSRPSAYHLNCIKKLVSTLDQSHPVAVLGCTPEFRDLLVETGHRNIYILDKNKDFFKLMTELRIHSSKENVVYGDWMDTLSNYKNYFSLILSDLTIGNIPYDKRKLFYQLVTQALKKDGIFVDKVLTHPLQHIKLHELMDKYSKLPLNLIHINYFSCEFFFCSELLDMRCLVDSTLFYKTLEKKFKNKRLLAFLNNCTKITPPGCLWYYGKKWAEIKTDYCSELTTHSIFEDIVDSPYYSRLKLFVNIKT